MTTARIIGLGTHHKTGTVWMDTVFRKLSKRLSIPRTVVKRKHRIDQSWIPETGRCFVMNWNSNFPKTLLNRDDARFIHVVRDPRDILISGLFYHLRTENERFLHLKRDDLGGKTYQEHLRSLETLHEQFLFEMDNKHAKTIAGMRDWNRDAANSFEFRYEDLIADTDCTLFEEGMRFVGLDGAELATARDVFWKNSLFGGLAEVDPTDAAAVAGHIRSGKVEQWKTGLPSKIAEVYLERFGDDLIALGYETDKSWLSQITYDAPAQATSAKEEVSL